MTKRLLRVSFDTVARQPHRSGVGGREGGGIKQGSLPVSPTGAQPRPAHGLLAATGAESGGTSSHSSGSHHALGPDQTFWVAASRFPVRFCSIVMIMMDDAKMD